MIARLLWWCDVNHPHVTKALQTTSRRAFRRSIYCMDPVTNKWGVVWVKDER